MKRPALQNKQVRLLPIAFRALKVFGTFEKRAPGPLVAAANLDETYLPIFNTTVEPRLSGPRLSGLFLWFQFGYDYLLVTIKIRSHILFKTTALKGAVKCKGFLLSKSKGSARACRKEGDIGIFGFAVLAIF